MIVEAGGFGAITPAAFGLFSAALPPFRSPRSRTDDRSVLLEELHALGEHASSAGAVLLLEPLNRYEDHMVNTLAQAVSLVEELGQDSVRVMADTFHMNIEEADPAGSLASRPSPRSTGSPAAFQAGTPSATQETSLNPAPRTRDAATDER